MNEWKTIYCLLGVEGDMWETEGPTIVPCLESTPALIQAWIRLNTTKFQNAHNMSCARRRYSPGRYCRRSRQVSMTTPAILTFLPRLTIQTGLSTSKLSRTVQESSEVSATPSTARPARACFQRARTCRFTCRRLLIHDSLLYAMFSTASSAAAAAANVIPNTNSHPGTLTVLNIGCVGLRLRTCRTHCNTPQRNASGVKGS